MRQLILYITFLFIGHFVVATSFEFVVTNNHMTVSFSQPSTVFGYDSVYAVGAFVKRNDTLLCVGRVEANNKPSILNLAVYGKEGNVEGALEEEEIIFLGFSTFPGPQKCEIILFPTKDDEKITVNYSSNKSESLDSWISHDVTLDYLVSDACTIDNELIDNTVEMPPLYNYALAKYTSEPEGLFLNHSTGDIYPHHSLAGNYIVSLVLTTGKLSSTVVDHYCIIQSSFEVHISDTASFAINDYIIENNPQPCNGTQGSLVLDTLAFPFKNASFQIKENDEVETYFFQETYEFEEGNYSIKSIIEQNGCEHSVDYSFVIERNGDCDESYVLMPFTENAPHEILFDQEGEIKIVNQNGVVIKQLTAPTTWNGEQEDGSLVDMGVYFIYNDNQFVKNLHVYR